MPIKAGQTVLVSPNALADALEGQTWGVPDDNGAMYDGEFTGETLHGNLVVKIKRKSEKQPK